MATTTTAEAEDRVLATAQRIVHSLRISKDVTDDMLLILSSFDNRFSNISDLISGSSKHSDPFSARFEAAEKVIPRHENHRHYLFDADSSTDEVCEFLAAVDDVLDLIADLRVDNNSEVLDRAEAAVQSAMSKLEEELRRLLLHSSVTLDADRLYRSIRCVTLAFASHDGDLIDGDGFGVGG